MVVLLAWPAENGSLGAKTIRWLADPTVSLPEFPGPLPMGLGDNADAVAAHDAQEAEYYRLAASSSIARMRLRLKVISDPLDPTTERQLLVGIAVIGGLIVWRLGST